MHNAEIVRRRCRAASSRWRRGRWCRSAGASRHVVDGAAAEHLHDRRHAEEYDHGPHGPDDAGANAQPQEVALELAGDEAVGGADEMQHLDDLAVGGQRAAGGGDDDGGGCGADQQQDGEAAERERARDGADLLLPAAVIVERCALGTASSARPAAPRVRAARRGRARWRSGAARAARASASDLAEPRLEQLRGILEAERRWRARCPGCCAGRPRRRAPSCRRPSRRAARSAP